MLFVIKILVHLVFSYILNCENTEYSFNPHKRLLVENDTYVPGRIVLGETYFNEFEILQIRKEKKEVDIRILYQNDKNQYIYDSIVKYHPKVSVFELTRSSNSLYTISDTLFQGELADTLTFEYKISRLKEIAISNDTFGTFTYRLLKW